MKKSSFRFCWPLRLPVALSIFRSSPVSNQRTLDIALTAQIAAIQPRRNQGLNQAGHARMIGQFT